MRVENELQKTIDKCTDKIINECDAYIIAYLPDENSVKKYNMEHEPYFVVYDGHNRELNSNLIKLFPGILKDLVKEYAHKYQEDREKTLKALSYDIDKAFQDSVLRDNKINYKVVAESK